MKSTYPSAADLSAFLDGAFHTQAQLDLSSFDLATAAQAGTLRFERETGRVMLATASSARTFDPPVGGQSMLNLGEELAEVVTVTAQGTTQVALTDYRLLPQNAGARGRPYNLLQLNQRFYPPIYPALWNSVVVTGYWGYSRTGIGEDAWMAMLAAGALWLLPEIVTQVAGGAISVSEADMTESYGAKPFDFLREQWDMLFDRALARWRRVTVGV